MTKEELKKYIEFNEKIKILLDKRDEFSKRIIDRDFKNLIGKRIIIPDDAYVHAGKQGIIEYMKTIHNNKTNKGMIFKFGGSVLKKNGEISNYKFDFQKTIIPT